MKIICSYRYVLYDYCYVSLFWGDTGVDGRIILRQIFRKCDVGVWTGLSWLRIEKSDWQL
jgi:hypothetical protein